MSDELLEKIKKPHKWVDYDPSRRSTIILLTSFILGFGFGIGITYRNKQKKNLLRVLYDLEVKLLQLEGLVFTAITIKSIDFFEEPVSNDFNINEYIASFNIQNYFQSLEFDSLKSDTSPNERLPNVSLPLPDSLGKSENIDSIDLIESSNSLDSLKKTQTQDDTLFTLPKTLENYLISYAFKVRKIVVGFLGEGLDSDSYGKWLSEEDREKIKLHLVQIDVLVELLVKPKPEIVNGATVIFNLLESIGSLKSIVIKNVRNLEML